MKNTLNRLHKTRPIVGAERDEIDFNKIKIHEFNGTAKWAKDYTNIAYEDISCMQVNTRYINAYVRYFESNTAS